MTVRTIHIREMLDQAQHLAGRAARLAAMAETTLPGMEKAQRTELERAIVLVDRAAGLAEHAKAELRDELFRATHGDDIDAHLLGCGFQMATMAGPWTCDLPSGHEGPHRSPLGNAIHQ